MKQINLAGQRLTGMIDRFNDRLTQYRLVLYSLIVMLAWAAVGSLAHRIPYSLSDIVISTVWLTAVCWVTNKLLSSFLNIPANKESSLITALILALILSPADTVHGFAVLTIAAVVGIVSKYIITVNKSHIFNPAGTGAVVVGLALHDYAAWWVGTSFMTPVVAILAVLILRKTKRYGMALIFLAVYLAYLAFGVGSGPNPHFLWQSLVSTQAIFFATIMLTEPLTTPTSARFYLPYAVLVGLLYSITALRLSPEEALLIGNLFSFLLAPKRRFELKFRSRIKEADGIYSYIFDAPPKFNFQPGQYMEWTLPHQKTDSRGNRRYFTISSSPTEPGLMFTVKQPANGSSSFKRQLDSLRPGETILASYLAGDFTLPKDDSKKLALLAGGVGITPFRSMVKHMIDSRQSHDAALIYSADSQAELAFTKLFRQAAKYGLGFHTLTGERLSGHKLKNFVPDYTERTFYISGPYGFVQSAEAVLLKLGVPAGQIMTDYFPGYDFRLIQPELGSPGSFWQRLGRLNRRRTPR